MVSRLFGWGSGGEDLDLDGEIGRRRHRSDFAGDPNGGVTIDLAATRFQPAPWLVPITARRAAGRRARIVDTGVAPHHDVVHADRDEWLTRTVGMAHRVVPNPYCGTGG